MREWTKHEHVSDVSEARALFPSRAWVPEDWFATIPVAQLVDRWIATAHSTLRPNLKNNHPYLVQGQDVEG